jgi:hypothetical protein
LQLHQWSADRPQCAHTPHCRNKSEKVRFEHAILQELGTHADQLAASCLALGVPILIWYTSGLCTWPCLPCREAAAVLQGPHCSAVTEGQAATQAAQLRCRGLHLRDYQRWVRDSHSCSGEQGQFVASGSGTQADPQATHAHISAPGLLMACPMLCTSHPRAQTKLGPPLRCVQVPWPRPPPLPRSGVPLGSCAPPWARSSWISR